ncbi:MAG: hypothetical protein KGV57_01450, partial [Fusobacterium sp.]|nr:hypothetical protein [Fusobacterium sp.]
IYKIGNFGYVNLDKGLVVYDDFEEEIKDINIKFLFDKTDIRANADYNIFGNKEKANLTLLDKKLNISASLKNINSEKILKYKFLQDKKIDLGGINIKNIFSKLTYSKNEGLSISVNSDLNNSKFKNIIFKDLKLNYFSKDKEKSLKNSYLLVDIFDMEEKILFDMENKKENIYNIKLKNSSDKASNLIPNIEADINFINEKEKLNFDFSSDLVNFKGNYFKEKNKLEILGENFNLDFDNKNKFIIFKSIKNKQNNLALDLFYNLANNNFDLKYDANKFELNKKYKDEDIFLNFSGKGFVKKENNIISSKGNIQNLSGKYKNYFLENLSTNYFTKQENKKTVTELHGEVSEIFYDKYSLAGLRFDLGLKDNILKIFDIENSKISTHGEVNLRDKNIDLSFNINNLNNEDLMLDKLSFNLGSLKGNIFGNLKNPSSNIIFDNLELDLDKYGKLNTNGELNLKDKKINIPFINSDNHKLTGNYDIETGRYNGRVNLFEENVNKYSPLKELRARLISQIDITGIFSKESKELNALIEGNLDRVFYKTKNMPNLYFNLKYANAKDFIDGLLEINKISILNERKKEIISLNGQIDLAKKYLEIFTENKEQEISLSKLKSYFPVNYIKGKFLTDFYAKGNFENPYYKLSLKSCNTKVKDVELDDIEILLTGDTKRVNLEKFNLDYAKNIFYGNGAYNLKDKTYSLNLKSNEVDFIVLNKFLKDRNIENLSGKANVDIRLNQNNSSGSFKVSDLSFNIPKYNFKLSDLNSKISLKNDKIIINSIKSNMNDGNFEADGYIEVPKTLTVFNKEILKKLNYSINTKLDNFRHKFPDVSDIAFHSNILLSNKKIEGALYLDDGTIYDIPNNYKSIWKIISSFLFKKVKKNKKDNKVEYELPDYLKDLPYLNLAVIANKPLILNMNNFTTFVDEVKGEVYANLNLKGENGKFYILGNVEGQKGHLILNSNLFELDKALVSFNKKDLFLPKFDPNISLESRVRLANDTTNFNISGNLKKLRYNIASRSGSSNGELNSLIEDIKNGEVQTETNTPYYNLLKNIISDQVTQTFFGKTTKTVKNMFNLSKLRLRSDISTSNINDIEYFIGERENSVKSFRLNTILEVEDNLYKDKIFINANTRLFSTNTNLNDRYSKINDDKVREYDVNLEYRQKNYSIGVGVGNIPQKYRTDLERDYDKKNYHVNFKFRKKFNNFSELFSF